MKQIIFAGFIIFLVFTGCDDKKTQTETGDSDKSSNDSDINDKDVDEYVQDADEYISDMCCYPDDEYPDDVVPDTFITPDEETIADIDYIEPDENTDPDIIPDEDILNCAVIGESVPVMPDAKECCEGLQKVGMIELKYIDHRGYCESMDGSSVCINCGNSVCDLGENVCNCPQDCLEERDKKCDDGTIDTCDTMPPIACEPGFVLAIQNSCWKCVDEITCK